MTIVRKYWQSIEQRAIDLTVCLLIETLPKALRTQALTALTSNFGLIGLVQYVW